MGKTQDSRFDHSLHMFCYQLFVNFNNHYYYTYSCGQGDPIKTTCDRWHGGHLTVLKKKYICTLINNFDLI